MKNKFICKNREGEEGLYESIADSMEEVAKGIEVLERKTVVQSVYINLTKKEQRLAAFRFERQRLQVSKKKESE